MNTSLPFLCPRSVKAAVFALLSLSTTLAAQSIFPLLPPSVSTIPSNGDVNPYGIFIAPKTMQVGGGLQAGDILVSNFNNAQKLQGLGTTILRGRLKFER